MTTPTAWEIGILSGTYTICAGLQIKCQILYGNARESMPDWILKPWAIDAQRSAARLSLADRVLRGVEP